VWKADLTQPRCEQYHVSNSAASPSPVIDGGSVYVFFGDFGRLAFDWDGHDRWRLPLGPFNNRNGHGTSPILEGDLLILLCDQDSSSYAVEKSENWWVRGMSGSQVRAGHLRRHSRALLGKPAAKSRRPRKPPSSKRFWRNTTPTRTASSQPMSCPKRMRNSLLAIATLAVAI
jgi:hypothetical protein